MPFRRHWDRQMNGWSKKLNKILEELIRNAIFLVFLSNRLTRSPRLRKQSICNYAYKRKMIISRPLFVINIEIVKKHLFNFAPTHITIPKSVWNWSDLHFSRLIRSLYAENRWATVLPQVVVSILHIFQYARPNRSSFCTLLVTVSHLVHPYWSLHGR